MKKTDVNYDDNFELNEQEKFKEEFEIKSIR